jgi:hypothetical protein
MNDWPWYSCTKPGVEEVMCDIRNGAVFPITEPIYCRIDSASGVA